MRADVTEDNTPAFVLMDELGNTQHAPPFLAIFPADRPTDPQTLSGEYSKDELLELIARLPDPSKPQAAEGR